MGSCQEFFNGRKLWAKKNWASSDIDQQKENKAKKIKKETLFFIDQLYRDDIGWCAFCNRKNNCGAALAQNERKKLNKKLFKEKKKLRDDNQATKMAFLGDTKKSKIGRLDRAAASSRCRSKKIKIQNVMQK